MEAVLLLNQNYEPLNVCNTRRAFGLLDAGKAEVLEHANGGIRTPSRIYPRPSVIRLVYLVKRPRPRAKLSRREIFLRDRYTCQYCGTRTRDLTLDHVIPRHRGGEHSWENLVSACRSCNHRKGGKALQDTKLRLLQAPQEPRSNGYHILYEYLQRHDDWAKFLPEWLTTA
jgi:5-methylcytosine-specific restriction endonuclease McrA